MDNSFQEIRNILKENAIQLEKLAVSQTKNEIEFSEYKKQSEKKFQKLAESQEKTDKQIKEISKELGGIGNSLGDSLEYSFFTALRENLKLEHTKYDKIYKNLKNKYVLDGENNQQEFDIVLENGKTIAIIEVKSKPDVNDLEDLERIKKAYKPCFPMDKDKEIKIYLGSNNYSDDIVNKANKKNIKLLTLKNDIVEVLKASIKNTEKQDT